MMPARKQGKKVAKSKGKPGPKSKRWHARSAAAKKGASTRRRRRVAADGKQRTTAKRGEILESKRGETFAETFAGSKEDRLDAIASKVAREALGFPQSGGFDERVVLNAAEPGSRSIVATEAGAPEGTTRPVGSTLGGTLEAMEDAAIAKLRSALEILGARPRMFLPSMPTTDGRTVRMRYGARDVILTPSAGGVQVWMTVAEPGADPGEAIGALASFGAIPPITRRQL
jgi:hypothetical protein